MALNDYISDSFDPGLFVFSPQRNINDVIECIMDENGCYGRLVIQYVTLSFKGSVDISMSDDSCDIIRSQYCVVTMYYISPGDDTTFYDSVIYLFCPVIHMMAAGCNPDLICFSVNTDEHSFEEIINGLFPDDRVSIHITDEYISAHNDIFVQQSPEQGQQQELHPLTDEEIRARFNDEEARQDSEKLIGLLNELKNKPEIAHCEFTKQFIKDSIASMNANALAVCNDRVRDIMTILNGREYDLQDYLYNV